MRLFSFEKLFVTCYTLRLVTISKMHCPSNCETSTVGLSPSPAVIRAEPIVLNILMCQYMSRQDWSRQTKETVYPPLFFPTLQMGRKSGLHSFSPSVRWKSESVPPTLFSHCNKMEKKSVPPTLFFPIIEGEKVQRVRNYPYPYIHWRHKLKLKLKPMLSSAQKQLLAACSWKNFPDKYSVCPQN